MRLPIEFGVTQTGLLSRSAGDPGERSLFLVAVKMPNIGADGMAREFRQQRQHIQALGRVPNASTKTIHDIRVEMKTPT